MKAIITKYHGPTDTRGSRISARDSDHNRISLPYDCYLNSDENHDGAAKTLCIKLGWVKHPLMRGSAFPDGYVYVFDSPLNRVPFTPEEQQKGRENTRR